jgi:hypothetical protein
MGNFDNSRLADLKMIDDKLHDPATSRRGKLNLERSRAAILRQESNPQIKTLRSRLLQATQAGDANEVSKIQEQLQRFDQSSGFDQHEDTRKR